jgi:hypothetical protein
MRVACMCPLRYLSVLGILLHWITPFPAFFPTFFWQFSRFPSCLGFVLAVCLCFLITFFIHSSSLLPGSHTRSSRILLCNVYLIATAALVFSSLFFFFVVCPAISFPPPFVVSSRVILLSATDIDVYITRHNSIIGPSFASQRFPLFVINATISSHASTGHSHARCSGLSGIFRVGVP